MTSKLIALCPHEAQIQLELSLRNAYSVNIDSLTPPLKFTVLSPEKYLDINKAVVYGVLCEPSLANAYIKYLHAHVNDGYCLFIKLVVEIVDVLYTKLLELPKVQLIWVASVMIDVCGVGFDGLLVSLMRQVVGGDFSDGNLWLSYEVVSLLLSKWDLILDEEPVVLGYGLYNYLRLLADHYRLPESVRSAELKRREIGFCVKVLREQFHLCLRIGRDLIRLLQDLGHIPEFREIWGDLLSKPSSFGVPSFSDVSVMYGTRTSSRYFLLRVTPEMETQLRFMLTHVKLGAQRRHQAWFARKFLFGPERESLISDIVRFISGAHHPSNEVLQSEVIPRWAVIGWLLKSCTKKYIEASVKLSLFYDWLFFDEKVDNFMNVEPGMLLMVNSLPRYIDMTNSLLEFLLIRVENYDTERKNVILKGVSSAMNLLVRKGVVTSLDVLTSCNLLSPSVKRILDKFMLDAASVVHPEPGLLERPSLPSSDASYSDVVAAHPPVNAEVITQRNLVSELIDVEPLSGVSDVDQVEDVGYLIGKIGDSMKISSMTGQKIVEKILLSCSCGRSENQSDVSSEILACQIQKELELVGYKLFSPFENIQNSGDSDDEVQSVTSTIIRAFIYNQHERVKEMLCWWSKHGCIVQTRLLSYALRLVYEANEWGYGGGFEALPLLKFHIEGYFTLVPGNGDYISGTIPSNLNVDRKVISKMIDDAFTAYKSIVFAHSISALGTDCPMSLGKTLSFDAMSCTSWKNKKLKLVFQSIFSYLSDLCLGDEHLIRLLVCHLDVTDFVSIQMDVSLKRYAFFSEDVDKFLQLIRISFSWNQADQYKFWSLAMSELIVSGLHVEKLLLCCFFSDDFDPKDNGIAFAGLMRLCNCHAPTAEIVGAVMLLPNDKLPDFAATVLTHWAYINQTMLSDSFADFLNKFENKNGDATLDWDDIVINHSALLYLSNYLEAQGGLPNNMLEKLGLNLSDTRKRLENSSVAMDTE